MKTAAEIQKERAKELEDKAAELLSRCDVLTLTSINENGYPRTCLVSKLKAEGFRDIYVETSKRSELAGKATHFERCTKASVCFFQGGDSVTLVGDVKIISDPQEKKAFEALCNKGFFKKGVEDPKHRLLMFHATEATFWIGGRFRTCTYK